MCNVLCIYVATVYPKFCLTFYDKASDIIFNSKNGQVFFGLFELGEFSVSVEDLLLEPFLPPVVTLSVLLPLLPFSLLGLTVTEADFDLLLGLSVLSWAAVIMQHRHN